MFPTPMPPTDQQQQQERKQLEEEEMANKLEQMGQEVVKITAASAEDEVAIFENNRYLVCSKYNFYREQ
jgi:hypothetical protein